MPRRKADATTVSQANGYFRRSLGRYVAPDGKLKPKVFLLGKSESQAIVRNARLQELWDRVVAEHEQQRNGTLELFDSLAARGEQLYRRDTGRPYARAELEQAVPHWTDETLPIAEALRRGLARVEVVRLPEEQPDVYAQRLTSLADRFPGITFVPAEADAPMLAEGRQQHASQARDHVARAQAATKIAEVPLSAQPTGQTLYAAIEAYAAGGPERH